MLVCEHAVEFYGTSAVEYLLGAFTLPLEQNRTMKSHILFLAAGFMLSSPLYAATFSWDASSGLFPDQVSSAMTLYDTSSPEDPQLAGGVLTLANDSNPEGMVYSMQGSDIAMPSQLTITARIRMISSSSVSPARTGAIISFTTASGIGNALQLGLGEIFLSSATFTRGPSATVDTTGAFHAYRIEVLGLTDGSTIQVFQDEVLALTGNLYSSVPDNGATLRVTFGEESTLASGDSRWTSFSHNAAAVPEPSTLLLISISACLPCILSQRRKRA